MPSLKLQKRGKLHMRFQNYAVPLVIATIILDIAAFY